MAKKNLTLDLDKAGDFLSQALGQYANRKAADLLPLINKYSKAVAAFQVKVVENAGNDIYGQANTAYSNVSVDGVDEANQDDLRVAAFIGTLVNASTLESDKKAEALGEIKKALITGAATPDALTTAFDAAVPTSSKAKSAAKGDPVIVRLQVKLDEVLAVKDGDKARFDDKTKEAIKAGVTKYITASGAEEGLNKLENTKLSAIARGIADEATRLQKDEKLTLNPDTLAATAVIGMLKKAYKESGCITEDDYKTACDNVYNKAGIDPAKDTDATKAFKASSDAVGNSVDKTNGVVRGVVAVGALALIWNRITAMFKTREEPDPNNPEETVKKGSSVPSKIAGGIAVLAAGFVAYRVGYKGQSFSDLGTDVSNFWQNTIMRQKAAAIPGLSPGKT